MNTGIVNSIWTKTVKTRISENSQVTLFSLDTNPGPFNLGFGKVDLKEGDDVAFNDNGEKYGEIQVDKGTLKINSRGNTPSGSAGTVPKPVAQSSGGGKSGYSRGNFPLDFTDGQRSILRQHAFTQASEVFRQHWKDEMQGGEWNPEGSVDYIINLAYKIEKYTSGDDIREEMKNI